MYLLYSPCIQPLGPQRLPRHLLYLPSIQHLGPQRLTRYLLYSPSIQYLGPQRLTKYLLYSPGTWDCSECRTLKSLSPKLYQSRHNLSAIQCQQGHNPPGSKCPQGHKRSYQTSYYSYSKCHTGTLAKLSIELFFRL